jgi:uncharacterized hydantoinase/oxoprolinase family protein
VTNNVIETNTSEIEPTFRTQEEYVAFLAREIEKAFDAIVREQALQSAAILANWNKAINQRAVEIENMNKIERRVVKDIGFLQKIINKLKRIF